MSIGVLGGTFDPIHSGHLVLAEVVRARLRLTEVLFVPAGHPWFKADNHISAADQRLEMVRLAIKDKPYFKLSTVELKRPGPTYTVDTMADFRRRLGRRAELYFILGWDNLKELPRWREPQKLISLCRLVAVPRIGAAAPDLKELEAAIPGITHRVVMMDEPHIDISASQIRERVAGGLSIEHLVPEAVAGYIKEQGLYQKKQ